MTQNNHLIIGIGGTGGRVQKELRKQLYDNYCEIPAGIGFMYIDSSDELIQNDDPSWQSEDGHNAQFTYREFLDISLKQPDSLTGVLAHSPNLKGIIENCERLKNYQLGIGTMQDRRLGRVLLGIHAADFDRLLHDSVHDLQEQSSSSNLNVTIVTGLSGGTGSGCVVSVVARILKLYPDANVTVMATLPTIPPPPRYDIGRYSANAYAALKELNALNIGRLELSDLVSGEKFQPGMPYDHSLNYCHKLQENKLFRLFLFENFYNDYDKISNILYHSLCLRRGNLELETYMRHLNMDNCINEPEFDASTPEGEELVYARTRAIGMQSLCRIVYPREQILRHLVQTSTSQAIMQMLYNNYRDGIGFIDKISEFDSRGICRHHADEWHLDFKSLTLQRPIRAKDNTDVRPFMEEWYDIIYSFGDYKEIKKVLTSLNNNVFNRTELADYLNRNRYLHYQEVEAYFADKRNEYKEYEKETHSAIEQYLLATWETGEYNVFIFSTELANYLYRNRFLHYQGVEAYFASKRNEAIEYAKEILSAIEQHLLAKWKTGEYGLCQLRQIYEALRDELQERNFKIDQQTENLLHKTAYIEKDIMQELGEVALMSKSKIIIILKEQTGEMQKKYLCFRKRLASLYSARTEIISFSFTKELIKALLNELYHTEHQLMSLMDGLRRMDENIRMKADNLLARNNQANSQNGIIDLSNHQDIEHYKQLMFTDKRFMQCVAFIARDAFAGNSELPMSRMPMTRDCNQALCQVQRCLKEFIVAYDAEESMLANVEQISPHFGDYITSGKTPSQFIEMLYPGWESSCAPLDSYHLEGYHELNKLTEAIDTYHQLRNVPYILKTNVLQEVRTQFPTTEALTSFVRTALAKVCDNIQLNDNEVLNAVRNNPLPYDCRVSPHKSILVRIPYADNEEEKFCSERFKAIVSDNCHTTQVVVDTEGPDVQEISIACVCTNFPLRCIKSLPGIRQQYDDLIANNGLQAVWMLHTEDSFANLPSLEVEGATALH